MSSSSNLRRHEFLPLPIHVRSEPALRPRPNGSTPGRPLDDRHEENERQRLVETARQKALDILSQAERDVDLVKEEAQESGFQDGYRAGLLAAETSAALSLELISELAERARLDAGGLVRGAEAQVVDLALRVARKVIERELTVDPKIVEPLVRAALNQMADAVSPRIRVHPKSLAELPEQWAKGVELLADENLNPGDCIVDVQGSTLDGRIETKLAELAAALEEELKCPRE